MARTRDEILAGLTVVNGHVWVTCHHCGGTGAYPSSCIPAGQCRFYCWDNRTPETFGKLAVPVERYVKRVQAAERRAAKQDAQRAARAEEAQRVGAERAARCANPDPRIRQLAELSGLVVEVPTLDTWGGDKGFVAQMIDLWVLNGELRPAQWEAVERIIREKQAEAARRAQAVHLGTEGEKLTVRATYQGERSFPGAYGPRLLLRFQDVETGSTLIWWTSAETRLPTLREGQQVELTGTVKKHGDYRGEPQTELTRCKLTPWTRYTHTLEELEAQEAAYEVDAAYYGP
jgi:hypothetical protein